MTRRTVARGIYKDFFGYEVRWRDRGISHAKRFPADVPLETLKAWRLTKITIATSKRAPVGSFTREATRWLMQRKGRPSFKSDRAHLRPWIKRFGRASRFAITRDGVQGAINQWQRQGYSPRELRHRWRILHQCLASLDPGAMNPCDGASLPTLVRHRPLSVSNETLTAVALQLRKQEMDGIGRLRSMKTRARFLVLATTGQRPCQVMRALPMDVDLDQRLWVVHGAKGDKGSVVYLNDEMLAAWRLFIAAKAWGAYDSRSFSKTLQRNGWPKGIRPYNTRHGVGQALRKDGADIGDIQDHLGHRSPATTSAFYLEPDLARLKATSERLIGRVAPEAFALPPSTTTTTKKQKAKQGHNAPQSAPRVAAWNGEYQERKAR